MCNQTSFLPLEVGDRDGDDQFWVITLKREWYENERFHTSYELRLRCRHCDFGYNSQTGFVSISNFSRMAEEAERHAADCVHTGRTIDLLSPEVRRN